MARSFLSLTIALAIAAVILGAGAPSAMAQPTISTTTATTPKPKEYPEVQAALKALNERKLDEALDDLRKAARMYSELPSEYIMMYRIMVQANQPNAARFWLEKAVTETPSDPEPWVILGSIALQDSRMAEAEIDFAKAEQLLGTYSNADRKGVIEQQTLSGMAQVAERRERWPEAQKRLEKFLEKSPEDLVALQRLARSMFWQKKVEEAYTVLKKAKDIDKKNAEKNKAREQLLPAEATMAQYYDAYERGAKYKKSANAETWYKYALRQAPNDLSLRAVVAVWALENGDIALAKDQAKEALRIEAADAALPQADRKYSGSTAGRMLSGYVALWEKQWADAEGYFEKVILEAPNDFAARNNIALALVEQDDPIKKRRAVEYAEGNYKNNKDNADAASTLSWVYFRTGQAFDQAGLAMDQVLKATNGNVSNPDTATYLAHILYHNGRKYEAKQILETIIGSGRPFSMQPEAKELYEKVKDEKAPAAAPAAGPTAPATTPKTP